MVSSVTVIGVGRERPLPTVGDRSFSLAWGLKRWKRPTKSETVIPIRCSKSFIINSFGSKLPIIYIIFHNFNHPFSSWGTSFVTFNFAVGAGTI